MDDMDKLSCKEEICDISDVEHSAISIDDTKVTEGKVKKKRRRRREIDLKSEDDETEDEGTSKKMYRRISPGPGPISPASHREPRTCVLKIKGKALSKEETLLLLGLVESSNIVNRISMNAKTNKLKAMEWCRITEKFNSVAQTTPRTPEQLRLKWQNLKKNLRRRTNEQASQKRRPLSRLLEQLLRNLEKRDPNQFFAWPVNDNFAPGYSTIIKRPMDFSTMKQKIDDNEYKSLNCFISDFKQMCNNAMKYNKVGTVYHKAAKRLLHAGLKQLTPQKLRPLGDILTYMYEIPIRELGFDIGKMDVHKVLKRSSPIKSGGSEAEVVSDGGQDRQDSGDSVKIQMEAAREQHRRRLAKKAFPRMDSAGRTTLRLVTRADDVPTVGQLVGKLQHGTGSLHTAREDRRNAAKCVRALHYGPFSSYAPAYDGTFASLTKDESHLVYHTLPSETGQGNEEMLRFAPDSPWQHIYDMEAMFPDKKNQPEPTTPKDDESQVQIDVAALRSLAELGIDVEWVSELEEALRDHGLGAALATTHGLLATLEAQQRERLSASTPWHLSLCRGAGGGERETARLAAGWLRGMLARVPPRHVAPRAALRAAMGVTLDHLDTPMAVDDFEMEMHEPRDAASDRDSRSSHDK